MEINDKFLGHKVDLAVYKINISAPSGLIFIKYHLKRDFFLSDSNMILCVS